MSDSQLPPNATAAEVAIEAATARVGAVPVEIRTVWHPDVCPAEILPWLAWALSVDNWDPQWPVSTQRAVISAAVEVHRRKGTRAAVVQALSAAGHPQADVRERYGRKFRDGSLTYNGAVLHDEPDHWAEYRVFLERPMTNDQAQLVRGILGAIAPARCHLKQLNFTAAAHTHNGAIRRDGSYNYGSA